MSPRAAWFTVGCLCYITTGLGQYSLYQNEICDMRGSSPWTCQKAEECPHIRYDLDRGMRPRICGFEDSQTYVCCKMRPSIGWCLYYEKFACPRFAPVVYGGEKSLSREFPHMALIGYGSKEQISWQCGGSLISDQFVMSAAHCANPSDQIGPAKWVRLGDLDISTDKDDAKPEDFFIIETIVHPEYDPVSLSNDIALFKLHRKVTFSEYIRPTCLHPTHEIDVLEVTVTGWGRLEFVGPTSKHLMKAKISLFSHDDCERLNGNSTQRRVDSRLQLCAGEVDGARDTCQGDSGGPVTISRWWQCPDRQVGITSFGKQCGLPESPGIYTRVSNYLPWIESIVWP